MVDGTRFHQQPGHRTRRDYACKRGGYPYFARRLFCYRLRSAHSGRRRCWCGGGRRPFVRAQQLLDCRDQAIAKGSAFDPLLVRQHVFEPADRLDAIDPQRVDRLARLGGKLDFAEDMFAFVGSFREQQQHRPTLADRIHDLRLIGTADRDITAGNPTANLVPLEIRNEVHRRFCIRGRMANKQVALQHP